MESSRRFAASTAASRSRNLAIAMEQQQRRQRRLHKPPATRRRRRRRVSANLNRHFAASTVASRSRSRAVQSRVQELNNSPEAVAATPVGELNYNVQHDEEKNQLSLSLDEECDNNPFGDDLSLVANLMPSLHDIEQCRRLNTAPFRLDDEMKEVDITALDASLLKEVQLCLNCGLTETAYDGFTVFDDPTLALILAEDEAFDFLPASNIVGQSFEKGEEESEDFFLRSDSDSFDCSSSVCDSLTSSRKTNDSPEQSETKESSPNTISKYAGLEGSMNSNNNGRDTITYLDNSLH